MRLGLAGLALLAAALLSGCAAQAKAGPPPTTTTAPTSTTTTTTVTTVVTPPPTPPPCGRGVSACVSLSTKQAWLMANGTVTRGPVPITHGGTTNPTPTGTWPVAWKDQEHTSSIYGDSMPYSVFFAPGGIAFHEGRLDENSHGCVRLKMIDARAFFTTLAVGGLVQVVP
jgi:hypothetical protein